MGTGGRLVGWDCQPHPVRFRTGAAITSITAKGFHFWADVPPTLLSCHARSAFVIGDAAQLARAVAKQAYNPIDMASSPQSTLPVSWLAGR